MSSNSPHPEIKLFDYLNGLADQSDTRAIETHLSECDECASVAALIRSLKTANVSQTQETGSEPSHPAINELASFFYLQEGTANLPHVASHVASCTSCAEAISQYAQADKTSEKYEVALNNGGEVPQATWEMINEWESSPFANFKPANEVLGQEFLDRLSHLLKERDFGESAKDTLESIGDRVPVLVLDSSGEVRSVELFEWQVDQSGASVLRHSEGSIRFDSKPIHALFSSGEKEPLVVSTILRRDSVRIEQARVEDSRRADYFIIED